MNSDHFCLADANNFLLPPEGQSQGQQGNPVTRQASTPPAKKRRPYHGWVGSWDDDDLVELPGAPTPEVLKKLFVLPRKTRWDVQPESK